jgi:puromycin-sensitive aminopeptidase
VEEEEPMTPDLRFDKNLRLPADVRPTSYDARLDLEPAARRFRGSVTITLALDAATREIVLHAVDLDVTRASCRAAGHEVAVTVTVAALQSQALLASLARPVGPGAAELRLEWTGAYNPGLRGLYAAGPLGVTQFESTDARRVFPCFDEPSFKAPWSLTLTVPAGEVVLSNTVPAGEEVAGDRRTVRFTRTPPLPTYLVALACGPLAGSPERRVGPTPVRTWTVPGKVHLAGFAQDVAVATLPRLEEYFGLPYAFGKLDMVAVPDFEAGAMENAGLVTFRESTLLLDEATAALPTQKRVAEVITHELAHQWFGNLVTMAWWDDLWLNEAFATWMAFKIVDAWRPEWRMWLEFDAARAAALHLDALVSTHPIRAEVKNADEAEESFDRITYEKGGAVLRMIEAYLGARAFRDGIRLYMRRHQTGNARADDLWGALAEASGQPILALANAWVRTPGYPLVAVHRDGRTVTLRQRRFFSEPGREGEGRWPVPVVLRFDDEGGPREQRVLLDGAEATVALEGRGEVQWLVANQDAAGFYRVAYADADLAAIAPHLARLTAAERIALLSDEWALVRRGEREVAAFLDLCARFGGERDHAVLDALEGRLAALEPSYVTQEDRPRFRAWVAALLGPQMREAGWDPGSGESGDEKLRRAALVAALGLVARDPAVITEGTHRLERLLAGEAAALAPDLHPAAVTMAARAGDASRFERLRGAARAETDPAYKRRYLMALAAFEDPALAVRATEMALDPEVPLQELSFFLAALLVNPSAREASWAFVRERWDEVLAKATGAPAILRRIVEAIRVLPERHHLEEARRFLGEHPVESARQTIAQTLEGMAQDVALRERLRPAIHAWLETRARSSARPGAGHTP